MARTILIVDDEENIRTSLQGVLEDEGYRTLTVDGGQEALALVQLEVPDLVLLDIWMPGMDGIETLQKLRETVPSLMVVMISGHGTIETAVRCTKLGAYDFIEKPLSLEKVILTTKNALDAGHLIEENRLLRGDMVGRCELIGTAPVIVKLKEQVQRIAGSEAPVLIVGETGSGKEVVAQALHRCSARHEHPYVVIHCAAIPDELLDAELFGHERGAVPGGTSQKKGRVELADGGTIFLEEVAALPLALQAKMLRFLEESVFERVGGTRTIEADLRVIASSSRNLAEECANGTFLPGLYQQISIISLEVPPLRERIEDIPLLVEHFLDQFGAKHGRVKRTVSPGVLSLFASYDWPGNIRELRNMVERLVIMSPGPMILAEQLPEYFHDLPAAESERSPGTDFSLHAAREQFEKEFIRQKLAENDWNVSRTAEMINLERSNLQRKIIQFQIDVKN